MHDDVFYSAPELARDLGITPRAIRFYESKNLISPARAGTTRVYTKQDRGRLILILRGKRLGFSLAEISDFLKLYDSDATQKEQIRLLIKKVRLRRAALLEQQKALETVLLELDEIEAQSHDALSRMGVSYEPEEHT